MKAVMRIQPGTTGTLNTLRYFNLLVQYCQAKNKVRAESEVNVGLK